ncbi:MAG: sulfurtransferase [Chloroflexi bacterium]|nr:MAG: sulfurtransferase [Chloroflexota bacterium]RLC78964.1 MAG: sulfurtransferase [Chloroflexota bacterium]
MTTKVYDAIIVGAGSVGLPAAFYMAQAGLEPLVIDQFASPGQGSNKAAIGGIRATHSAPSKINLCLKSLEIFSTWQETYGDDIEWYQGGYSFVAYGEREERILKDLLKIQQGYGLDIRWLERDDMLEMIPALNSDGIIGGTYSPGDGSASPLLTAHAFYTRAKERGAEFRFRERVTGIIRRRGKVVGVRTDQGGYATETVINAAGPWARALAQMAGLDVPVAPDSHEGGITEPVARFVEPMVVDIRPAEGSKNYYFYQHATGAIIFCITPEPPIVGTDRRETSVFLPMVARRMVDLMPKLANVKVRRTWRGLYPMTPDGFPIVGRARELEGYIYAVGMCGQGYMLGPGMGVLLTSLVQGDLTLEDEQILEELSPYREFGAGEKLK